MYVTGVPADGALGPRDVTRQEDAEFESAGFYAAFEGLGHRMILGILFLNG
jgi:hypothetical protein